MVPFHHVWLKVQIARDCRKAVEGSFLKLNGCTSSQGNNDRKTKCRISFIWLTSPIFSFTYIEPALIFKRLVLVGILIASMLVWEERG